jgi:integrase
LVAPGPLLTINAAKERPMATADHSRHERLTKNVVEAIEPPSTGYIVVWDVPRGRELRGLGLRINSGGARAYFAQGRLPGGKEVKPSIGRHGPWIPETARAKGQKLLKAIAAGIDPTEEKRAARAARRAQQDGSADRERQQRLVRTVGARWVEHMRLEGKRSADEVGRTLERHVYPELGDRAIESVTRADAHAMFDVLAAAGHHAMAHLVIRNLKTLMSFAVERGLREFNPLLRIKLGSKPRPRKRLLIRFHPERESDPAELVAIWKAAEHLEEPERTFVRVLILVCQRRDEVGRMRFDELDEGLWTVPEARHKGKRGHAVPLPRQAVELIDALPKERRVRRQMVPNEYVFTGKGGRPIGDFSRIKADLDCLSGVTGWQLQRDMRRTAATWMQDEGGFAKDDVHAVLGHSLGELQATYMAGPGYRRKKTALQAWANHVEAAVEGATDPKVVSPRFGRRG